MQLTDRTENAFKLQKKQKEALKRIKIHCVRDLLFYFPTRYGDTAVVRHIDALVAEEPATIYGNVRKLKTGMSFKGHKPFAEGVLEDETGKISLRWLNQPYIAKIIREGALVKVTGAPRIHNAKLSLLNPSIEEVKEIPIGTGDSLFEDDAFSMGGAIYPETRGVTSNWIRHALEKIFKAGVIENIEDPLPEEIIHRYNLPTLRTALIWIHMPRRKEDAEAAKKRFSFEEIFYIQIRKQLERKAYEERPSFVIEKDPHEVDEFIKRFPFKATDAQRKAVTDILEDFKSGVSMSRLLEGDVGSGKTAVAASTVFAVTTTPPPDRKYGALQTAYMAPTEILATQLFENFIKYYAYLGIEIGLITGSGCKKFPSKINPTKATDISRSQLLKWVAEGHIPILVGTHALIQKSVQFKNLAYIIIDEQHKFGIAQRRKLRHKDDNFLPHLLSMTATPIPRTLALTIYGDLDISLLDVLPEGRKPVKTSVVPPKERTNTYEFIRKLIAGGRQAYIICPRIDAPDRDNVNALEARSVIEETDYLRREIFPELSIEFIHGKMKPEEKDKVMHDFADGKIHILVSTSVVEVGVNVPNATMMIIEGAERFGLSQLHQLRGRIMRSSHEAHCFVFTDSESPKTLERLKALTTAKNGFELAEKDLAQRGPGQLTGSKQWGISDIGMEALRNVKIIEAAQREAKEFVKENKLSLFPLLAKAVSEKTGSVHLE